jgi:hypothetical protein
MDDRASVVEMAAALDDQAFAAPETAVGTRARAALASALAGDRRATRLGAALGAGGAQALARAVADASGRTVAARLLVQAVTLVCAGAPPLKEETRRALASLAASDQRLRAIASQI